MPRYELTDPTSGQTFQADFDSPPSDQDIDEVIANVSSSRKSPATIQPQSATSDFSQQSTSPPAATATDENDIQSPSQYQFTPPPAAPPEKQYGIGSTVAGVVARNALPYAATVAGSKIAGRVVAPITRAAGAWTGARVGAIAGALIPGLGETGIPEAIGGVVGGLVGYLAPGFIAGTAASKLQTDIANKVAPESILGSKVEQAQEEQHPIVAAVTPLLMLGKPNPMNVVRAGRTLASTEGRLALTQLFRAGADKEAVDAWTTGTAPELQKDVGNVLSVAQAGGINAAFNAADQIQSGHFSVTDLMKAAAEGTLFNSPWIKERNAKTEQFDASKPPVDVESEVQNASSERETTPVSVPEQGTGVGEETPLRQQGETANASGQEVTPQTQPQPDVVPPQEKPVITPDLADKYSLILRQNMQGRSLIINQNDFDNGDAHLKHILGKDAPSYADLVKAGLLKVVPDPKVPKNLIAVTAATMPETAPEAVKPAEPPPKIILPPDQMAISVGDLNVGDTFKYRGAYDLHVVSKDSTGVTISDKDGNAKKFDPGAQLRIGRGTLKPATPPTPVTPAVEPAQVQAEKKPVSQPSDANVKPPVQSTQTELTGVPSMAQSPKVSRGLRARKIFDSETRLNGPDIMSWIASEMRLLSKTEAQRKFGKERWSQIAPEYDDAAPLERPHHNVIYGGGNRPDQVAEAAYRAGELDEPSVPKLWDAIKKASATRANAFKTAKAQEKLLKQEVEEHEAWMKATQEGEQRVEADNLKVGDHFDVEGERIEVTAIDPETHEVTLKDGSRFGIQRLESGQSIYVENYNPSLESGTEFLPEDFSLEKPETIAEQNTRLASEQAQAEQRQKELAAAEEVRTRAAARLGGDLGSAGQGGLFEPEGQQEIFQQRAPVQPLNPGGSQESLPPEQQAISKQNNSREAFEALAKKTGTKLPEPPAAKEENQPLWKQVGYKSQEAFARDFQKNRLAEHDESEDEFLRRRYCTGTVSERNILT